MPQLAVAQQTVDARQVVLDQVSALVKGKRKADLDLSIAKVSVGQAKLLVVQAQNAIDEAEAELSAALGCQKPHRFTLVDEPQYPLPAVDMQELVDQALRYRPEIAALRAECSGTKHFAAAEHASQLPRITALGSAGRTLAGDPGMEGQLRSSGHQCRAARMSYDGVSPSNSRKNGAVRLSLLAATSSGVPQATSSPPAGPASGPISTM